MSFGFDGAHGTNVRPAHKPAVSSWAKDESAPGANDGTRLTASWANRIAGNIRRMAELASVGLTEDSDDDFANVIVAFVDVAAASKADIDSPTFTGTPAAPTAAPGTNTTQLATTAFVAALGALKANLASPAFTGVPTAPTAVNGTNTTQLATCAFVQSQIALLVASSPAALDTLNELAAALGNDANFSTTVTNALAAKAPLASPTFTGTPAAPTAAPGTNTTQLATTAFVTAAVAASSSLSIASQAEAEAGSDNTKAMTPLRTSQAIAVNTRVAKAWVRFNGTGTVAIAASHNVTSITDNGTGDYTVNFTTAMADTNYSISGSCTIDLTAGNFGSTWLTIYRSAGAIATGSVRVNSTGLSGGSPTPYDCSVVCVQVFR